MTKKILMLILVFLMTFSISIFQLYGAKRVKEVRVNDCIEIWMEKLVSKNDVEWTLYAGNMCHNPLKLGKLLKVTAAKNVTVDRGTILNLKDFIVPARDRKIVFMVTKRNPDEQASISWKLLK